MDQTDAELAAAAKTGTITAYEELVRRYQDLAFRTAYVVAADPEDAEEAVQEALIKAYRALDRFRPGAPFRPWLLRIVANEASNRRQSAHRQSTLSLRIRQEPTTSQSPTPEAIVLTQEQSTELNAALHRLREDDRLILSYRYFLDLPEAEIADIMQIARGTVKSRLSRALGRLRSILTETAHGS